MKSQRAEELISRYGAVLEATAGPGPESLLPGAGYASRAKFSK
jgi:hypothetical protein